MKQRIVIGSGVVVASVLAWAAMSIVSPPELEAKARWIPDICIPDSDDPTIQCLSKVRLVQDTARDEIGERAVFLEGTAPDGSPVFQSITYVDPSDGSVPRAVEVCLAFLQKAQTDGRLWAYLVFNGPDPNVVTGCGTVKVR